MNITKLLILSLKAYFVVFAFLCAAIAQSKSEISKRDIAEVEKKIRNLAREDLPLATFRPDRNHIKNTDSIAEMLDNPLDGVYVSRDLPKSAPVLAAQDEPTSLKPSIMAVDGEKEQASDSQNSLRKVEVIIRLPEVFNNLEIEKQAVQLINRGLDDVKDANECVHGTVKRYPASFQFSCEVQSGSVFSLNIRGFQTIDFTTVTLENEGGEKQSDEEIVTQVNPKDMISKQLLHLSTQNGAVANKGDHAATTIPFDLDWFKALEDGGRIFVTRYFEILGEKLPIENESVCLLDNPITPLDVLSDDPVVERELTCRLITLDRSGLPAHLAETLTLDVCQEGLNLKNICILRENSVDQTTARLLLEADGIWESGEFTLSSEPIELVQELRFSSKVPLFSGTSGNQIGGQNVNFMVTKIVVGMRGKVCSGKLEFSATTEGNTALAGRSFSEFQCGKSNVLPELMGINVSAVGDVEIGLKDQLRIEKNLNARNDQLAVSILNFVDKMSIALVAPAEQSLPKFFVAKFYTSKEYCEQSDSPTLLEVPLSASQSVVELNLENLKAEGTVTVSVLDGETQISNCQTINLVSLLGRRDSVVELEFIRPAGPFSLVVLSPSRSLLEAGWRNSIQAALRRMVDELREGKSNLPIDMFEITENRSLRSLILSQELISLPTNGSFQSVQGRFDRIRYDARVSSPLEDINIVESNLGEVELKEVLLIVDSTTEEFLPVNRGGLYYWLIDRQLKLHVVSYSGCDKWAQASENLNNKISCYDLLEFQNLSKKERIEKLVSLFSVITLRGK